MGRPATLGHSRNPGSAPFAFSRPFATVPAMDLHGQHLIDGRPTASSNTAFRATNPATGAQLDPPFHEATKVEVNAACGLAGATFPALQKKPPTDRATLL